MSLSLVLNRVDIRVLNNDDKLYTFTLTRCVCMCYLLYINTNPVLNEHVARSHALIGETVLDSANDAVSNGNK